MDKNLATATLAGGCFWCLEAAYQQVCGVVRVVNGYAGGTRPNPTYESVHYHNSGEAETVEITYKPTIISYSDILDIFWVIHDPTTPNRQGHDMGPEYRSVIFYQNATQQAQAEQSKATMAKQWSDPIVTAIQPLEKFYPAEPEHQDYYRQHPQQAYCQVVINPKLQKLQEKFAAKLR